MMATTIKRKQDKYFKNLSKKFEEKREALLKEIQDKHEDVLEWSKKNKTSIEKIGAKSARGLAAGVASGAVLFSTGAGQLPSNQTAVTKHLHHTDISENLVLKTDTREEVMRVLRESKGQDLEKKLSTALNMPVSSKLDGLALNTNYGIIGHESHLSRYPGDNTVTHFETSGDYQKFSSSGMAGGPGAWGYLAPSKNKLTQKDIERERYYLVAQTFLSPNWGDPGVKNWFRHRKMVVINPENGNAVVGAVEDAGPAVSTRRAFGGSPEVMDGLGFGHRGGDRVYMFFVSDPNDQIPLGRFGL
jgi:hypothetical protein